MEMNRRGLVGAALAMPALSACVTMGPSLDGPMRIASLTELLDQIKYDLGTYISEHSRDPIRVTQAQADAIRTAAASPEADEYDKCLGTRTLEVVADGPDCHASVNFDVVKIEIQTITTTDLEAALDAGLDVPFGLMTLTPAIQRTSGSTTSQTMSLTVIPQFSARTYPLISAPTAFDGQTPLATTLRQMRQSILSVNGAPPCFTFAENEALDQTLEWGFSTVASDKVAGKFALALFSLGAESTRSRTVANKIIATFRDPLGGFA